MNGKFSPEARRTLFAGDLCVLTVVPDMVSHLFSSNKCFNTATVLNTTYAQCRAILDVLLGIRIGENLGLTVAYMTYEAILIELLPNKPSNGLELCLFTTIWAVLVFHQPGVDAPTTKEGFTMFVRALLWFPRYTTANLADEILIYLLLISVVGVEANLCIIVLFLGNLYQ